MPTTLPPLGFQDYEPNMTLKQALSEQKELNKQNVPQISGLLGIPLDGDKRVEVPNRNAYVYVRLRNNTSEVIQAFNNQVSPSYNLPVLVERQGNRYVVVSVDTQRYENNWSSFSPFLPRHGNTHSFDLESGGGGDIVWVHSRQFMPLLALPSGSSGGPNVIISPYTLKNQDGTWRHIGNTGTQNLTLHNPSSPTGAIMALVYVDATTGNPGVLFGTGTVFPSYLTGTSQVYPYIPASNNPNWIPDVAVRLVTGTSVIVWDNMYDVRQWLHITPTGSSGGAGISSVNIQDEGAPAGTSTTFNFVGPGVDATVSGSVVRVSVPGVSGTSSFSGNPSSAVLTNVSGSLFTPTWLKWGGAPGAEYVEFGADKVGKESNAGKMGYEAFGQDFFAFVGAASGTATRKFKFFDDVYVDNDLFVNGGQQIVASKQVTNGDSHDHNGGDGAQVSHVGLASIGTNSHAQIDTHIASGTHVQNGNTHDHLGGDGGTIAYSSLGGAFTQDAGTYTPFLTGTTNVDSHAVSAPFTYMRLGNFVTVAGGITVDPTAAANTVIGMSIPIASNFTGNFDGTGNGASQLTNAVGNMQCDTTNDRMALTFQAPTTANMAWRVIFMYEIK